MERDSPGESGTLEEILLTPTEPPVPEPAEPSSVFEKPAGAGASLRTFRRTGAVAFAAVTDFGAETISLPAETESQDGSSLGLLPEGGTYTKEELAEAVQRQEERLADLRLDLKQSELKIRSTEKAVEEGAVLAKISGVVKKSGDPSNPPGTVPRFSRWPAPRACISVAGSASCCWIRSGRETW